MSRIIKQVAVYENDHIPSAILEILPQPLKRIIANAWSNYPNVEEIRLRKKKPLILRFANGESTLDAEGAMCRELTKAFYVTPEIIDNTMRIISKNSIYALETELKNGFITIPGGHRVGFSGEAVINKGEIKTQKNIASLNIRIARAVIGCSKTVLPYLVDSRLDRVFHTMLVSPPRCGKTTLLRDLIRSISYGANVLNLSPKHIGLVDERSEIAACYLGVPQFDVGPRTDVLDRSPKSQGMLLFIRSMGPDIIATDELGDLDDVKAVEQVVNSGVKLLTTVHGDSFSDLSAKKNLRQLIEMNVFERYVILNKFGTGRWIDNILDGLGKSIYKRE